MATNARKTLFIHLSIQMGKIKLYKYLIYIFIAGFISCETEPVETIFSEIGDKRGVFITCEGNYMYGNASISFYDKVNKVVYNNVFSGRNNAPLGDVAQSVTSNGKHLFIVVNNSGKVVVADPKTLEFRHAITGLVSPRYIHFVSPVKAYISDLYARRITIFNPETFEKTGYINLTDGKKGSLKHSSEFFVQVGNRVFVSSWHDNDMIFEIDPVTDRVKDSIQVPMQPRKMVIDRNNKLWVQCDGSFQGSPSGYEKPALVRIDPVTMTVEQIYRWEKAGEYAGDLQINPARDSLYIIRGDLYKMAVNARRIPDEPFIKANNRLFFSLGIDPQNGDIYLADAIDYMQSAVILRFNSGGIPVDTFRVGINPGNFWFN